MYSACDQYILSIGGCCYLVCNAAVLQDSVCKCSRVSSCSVGGYLRLADHHPRRRGPLDVDPSQHLSSEFLQAVARRADRKFKINHHPNTEHYRILSHTYTRRDRTSRDAPSNFLSAVFIRSAHTSVAATMGKKKRGHPDVEDLLTRPWCYYCAWLSEG
jgi:hypothetical protein